MLDFANPIQNFISLHLLSISIDLSHSKGLPLLSSHGIQIVNWEKNEQEQFLKKIKTTFLYI